MTGDGLGQLVRERREEMGLSQQELAERIGASRPYLSQIESGTKKWPRKYVPALSVELGLPRAVLERAAGRKSAGLRGMVVPPRTVAAGESDVRFDPSEADDTEARTWAEAVGADLATVLPELTPTELDLLTVMAAVMMQRHGRFPNVNFDLAMLKNLDRLGASDPPGEEQQVGYAATGR